MTASMTLDDEPEIINRPDGTGGEYEEHKSHNQPDSESDSETSSDEEQEDAPKTTRQKFEEIIKDLERCANSKHMKVGNYDLGDDTQLSNFLQAHEGFLSEKCTKDENLLHLIADQDRKKMPVPDTMSPLITALVRLEANLLAQRDDNGKTPLFCAVANKNRRLVKVMCDAHSDINSILKIPKSTTNARSTNCIHQAISKKSSRKDDALIKLLIEHANADTLLALNEDGLTPLHLAVEYKRCDEGQINVVEKLVNGCDKALDKTYHHPTKGPLSPYLYLKHTYEQASQQDKATGEGKIIRSKEEGPKTTHGSKEDSRNKPDEVSKEGQKNISTAEAQISEQHRIAQRASETPAGKFSSHSRMQDKNRGPLAVVTSIENNSKVNLKSPASKENDDIRSSRKSKGSKLKPDKDSMGEIQKFLRLYCLRKKQHDDAVEFLYGMQQDKQIYFDLIGIAPKITRDRITNGLNYLMFEDILQYVAIPWVEIEKDVVQPKRGQHTAEINDNSRTDMKHLFEWLRDVKGVKRILKVIVEDLRHPAHSDEVIESCLEGMGVETWDWKKFDLSPEVLHKVAPNVQVVHLYWSGNNAILRAWSEDEGLKKLEKLKTIHLHTQQGLETLLRSRQNIKEFRARMSPKYEVIDTKIKGGKTDNNSNGVAAAQDPYERHKWVTCMEEYAYFLQTAEREWPERLAQSSDEQERPQALQRSVTVALIDDGVDVNDQNVRSIIGGRSYCHRDEEQNLNQPHYISGGGHGTAMAGLICKVCPTVKLFILRLDEYSLEPGKRQITAKSAAKAVRDAIEKKVDIISMSWTIEKTDKNSNDIKELEDAITAAARENILMFCAATDQGPYKDRTYPAATSTKKIFKIGAAEASGAALKWIGDQTLVDFIFPGHQVILDQHGDQRVKKSTVATGSSIATALASGLAAVILYTVLLAEASQPNGGLREACQSLKNHDRMREAFLQIGTTKESENKYITVWNRFAEVVKQADRDSKPKDTWIDCIGGLAHDLMRKA